MPRPTLFQRATLSAIEAARAAHQSESAITAMVSGSPSLPDCLAEIYRLQATVKGPLTGRLAKRLEITRGGVVRLLHRLADAGLLSHQPYATVALTPAGVEAALRHMRRQRLLEVFLVNVMGFGWDELYPQVRGLSASLTPEFEARLVVVCGNPTHCPHGQPIPTADGQIATLDDVTLDQVELGKPLVVSRVWSDEPAKLRYLAQLGLTPGARLEIIARAPFDGPIRLQVDQARLLREHVIGSEVARCVRVHG